MISVFLSNLSSPPLLFFFLGGLAVLARSDLEIPGQVAKFLSLYLLFAIGFLFFRRMEREFADVI